MHLSSQTQPLSPRDVGSVPAGAEGAASASSIAARATQTRVRSCSATWCHTPYSSSLAASWLPGPACALTNPSFAHAHLRNHRFSSKNTLQPSALQPYRLREAQDSLHQHHSHRFKAALQKHHLKPPNSYPENNLKLEEKTPTGFLHPPLVREETKVPPPRPSHPS